MDKVKYCDKTRLNRRCKSVSKTVRKTNIKTIFSPLDRAITDNHLVYLIHWELIGGDMSVSK